MKTGERKRIGNVLRHQWGSTANEANIWVHDAFSARDDIGFHVKDNIALPGRAARALAKPLGMLSRNDVTVEFAPAAHVTVFNYAGMKDITDLFEGPVDVVSREGLKPYVRAAVNNHT